MNVLNADSKPKPIKVTLQNGEVAREFFFRFSEEKHDGSVKKDIIHSLQYIIPIIEPIDVPITVFIIIFVVNF